MNNLIITNSLEQYGEDNITSNQVVYYKEDDMVKFRANISNDPFGKSELITVMAGGGGKAKVALATDGTTITKDGQALTFNELKEIFEDTYIIKDDVRYNPSALDDNNLYYDGTYIKDDVAYVTRLTFSNLDVVTIQEVSVPDVFSLIEDNELVTASAFIDLNKRVVELEKLNN